MKVEFDRSIHDIESLSASTSHEAFLMGIEWALLVVQLSYKIPFEMKVRHPNAERCEELVKSQGRTVSRVTSGDRVELVVR